MNCPSDCREDIIVMARDAQKDERLSDGALYGKLADKIEQLHAMLAWIECYEPEIVASAKQRFGQETP
jgi:cAMP phosphodiesterase